MRINLKHRKPQALQQWHKWYAWYPVIIGHSLCWLMHMERIWVEGEMIDYWRYRIHTD